MRALDGRSAWVPRVPNFEATERLKFTAEEQQAIREAEHGFGCRAHMVSQPQPRPGLALAIALALAYLLSLTLAMAVLRSFDPPEPPHESEAPMADGIQREARSEAIPNSGTLVFSNQEPSSYQPPQAIAEQPSGARAHDPAGAPGQVAPGRILVTQVTGEENEH